MVVSGAMNSRLSWTGSVQLVRGTKSRNLATFPASIQRWVSPGTAEAALFVTKCGYILDGVGEYSRAIEYFEKGLAIYLKVYGDQHPNVAIAYNNIGGVYDSQGEYSRAIEYYEKALAIFTSVLGDDHPNTKVVAESLANAKAQL